MRDAHHAHVRAATHAALLHGVSRRIEDVHERHGAAGDAMGSADHGAARPKLFKSKASAAAGLMNDRSVGRCLHDAGDRVRHVEHKASGELTVRLSSVDEARRVGNKLARQHHLAHSIKK